MKRRSRIIGQFSVRLIEMMESPAYRVLSLSAHLVISRVEVELGQHGGNDNGKLPVTTDDFVEYGMHRTSVAPAIREAEALGFIRVTERGRGGNAEHRSPNKFLLTYAHGRGSRAQEPPHDWRRIKTLEEARKIARDARNAKDPNAVAYGKRNWKRRREKQEADTENSHVSVRKISTERPDSPVRKTRTTPAGEKPEPLSIARVGRDPTSGISIPRHTAADLIAAPAGKLISPVSSSATSRCYIEPEAHFSSGTRRNR
jgi:hypothetical protein